MASPAAGLAQALNSSLYPTCSWPQLPAGGPLADGSTYPRHAHQETLEICYTTRTCTGFGHNHASDRKSVFPQNREGKMSPKN